MIPLFDTHCHLQDNRLRESVDAVIERAMASGVSRMVCCGCREEDWGDVITLAQKYDCIIPAVGLHPWYVASRNGMWLERLRTILEQNPHCVVGEIGLDHQLPVRNDDEQMSVFLDQMTLAHELGRPVSVHCRKAWGSLLEKLRRGITVPSAGMVIHSFSGSAENLPELESYGISLSFSGSITYERNLRGRQSAAAVSDGALLVETDSPDIAPFGHEGINEPSTLLQTVASLAELRGTSIEKIVQITRRNAKAIFPW